MSHSPNGFWNSGDELEEDYDAIEPDYEDPVPDFSRPEFSEPIPDFSRPEFSEPIPDFSRPEFSEPIPDFSRPEFSEPIPDFSRPEFSEPVPDFSRPEFNEPVPDFSRPEFNEPVPDFSRPRFSEPIPDFSRPEFSEPIPDFSRPGFDEVSPDSFSPGILEKQEHGSDFLSPAPDFSRDYGVRRSRQLGTAGSEAGSSITVTTNADYLHAIPFLEAPTSRHPVSAEASSLAPGNHQGSRRYRSSSPPMDSTTDNADFRATVKRKREQHQLNGADNRGFVDDDEHFHRRTIVRDRGGRHHPDFLDEDYDNVMSPEDRKRTRNMLATVRIKRKTRKTVRATIRRQADATEDVESETYETYEEVGLPSTRSHRHKSLKERLQLIRQHGNNAEAARHLRDSLFSLDPTIVGSIFQGFETKKSQFFSSFLHFKIWSHHFKEIEGTFGSAIASYFRFLRWLLFLNIFIFLASFLIIVMPFFASSKPSSFADWVDTSFNSSEVNETTSYGYAHQAQNCSKKYLNDTQSSPNITDKILGLIIGTDWMATTSMFYGYYHNRTFSSEDDPYNYNMSLAYIMAIITIFSVSFLLIVKSSSHTVKEAVISSKETSAVHFTNSVLCGWDYCIVSEKAAATKKRILLQEFKADLLDQIKRIQRENLSRKERIQLLLVRICVNIVVLLILGGALYMIYYATDKLIEIKQQIKSDILRLIVEFTPSLVITILNVIVPEVFAALVKLEDYTPEFQIKIGLFRTVLLRLSSLCVLIFSLYYTLELDTRNAKQNCTEENTLNAQKCCGNLLWTRNSTGTIVMCWETYVGQQFYKLTIVDFFATLLLTFIIEFPRKLIFDQFKDISTFINTYGQQEFDIPQNVLDIVYTQNLCWLGVFFAPLLPCMTILKVFSTFYLKKLSLMKNIAPPQHTFKASRSNSFFMTILLLSFILAASLVGYMIGNIGPSKSCGPFRLYSQEKYYVWSSIINTISSWPKGLSTVLFFLGTAAFFIPVIVILCLLMYLFWTIGQGYKKMEEMLQERLKMEARDKQFLLARVNAIIKRGNLSEVAFN